MGGVGYNLATMGFGHDIKYEFGAMALASSVTEDGNDPLHQEVQQLREQQEYMAKIARQGRRDAAEGGTKELPSGFYTYDEEGNDTNPFTNKVSPLCTKRRESTTAPVGQTVLPSHL